MEKVLEGFVEKSEWEQEKRYGVRLFTIRRFKGHETAYQRSRYDVSVKLGKSVSAAAEKRGMSQTIEWLKPIDESA